MPTKWLQDAKIRNLSNFVTNGNFKDLRGVCLHVNVGDTPITFWGPGNPGSVVPNFQVHKDGSIDQMLPFNQQPWCQVDGNYNYAAIETAGYPTEPLTPQQIHSIARILIVYNTQYGVPLQEADVPGARGFITHQAGGSSWGGHACPGPIRTAQRADIIKAAKTLLTPSTPAKDFTKMTENDIRQIIREELVKALGGKANPVVVTGMTAWDNNDADKAHADVHNPETFFMGIQGGAYKTMTERKL